MKLTRLALASLLFAALALPTWADLPRPDPAVAEFARGVKFTVAGYDAEKPALTNFPVLVRLSDNSPSGFHYTDMMYPATGSDLCFVDMDGTPLAFEIDTNAWNTAGTSHIWVTLPVMTNNAEFVMCYRCTTDGAGALVSDANAWTNFVGVWHMGEPGNGAVTVYDSTPNKLHGTASAKSSAQSGPLGGARQITSVYNKEFGSILVPLSGDKLAAVNSLGTEFTVSFWMKSRHSAGQSGSSWMYLISRKSADTTASWGLQTGDGATEIRMFVKGGNDGDGRKSTTGATGLHNGNWHKVDAIYKSTAKFDFYWDGVKVSDNAALPTVAQQGNFNLAIGGHTSGSSCRSLFGDMDEVRLRCGVIDDNWVAATYSNECSAAFLASGEVESFGESSKPVAAFSLDDFGAAYAKFSGSVNSIGGGASSATAYLKLWPTASAEPDWTALQSGLVDLDTVARISTGLATRTPYSYKFKITNNLGTDSELISGTFETAEIGVPGTGGSVVFFNEDVIHTFKVEEDETAFEFTPPSYVSSIQALVVGGGGPGGYYLGGGGGAGGYIYNAAVGVTGGATYAINVGTGGVASASASAYGVNGGASSMVGAGVNLVANGGGAGGNGASGYAAGVAGGSGGGSAFNTNGGAGASGQGNAGGKGTDSSAAYAGGGGGASAVGANGSKNQSQATWNGGKGGDGKPCDITGETVYYAGGGGGGGTYRFSSNTYSTPAGGGDGGGGRGGQESNVAEDKIAAAGVAGLGGGGGGGSGVTNFEQGGNGGSGIVIVRYSMVGDGSGIYEPIISMTSATYNDADATADVGFNVVWAGDGFETVNVSAIYGYSEDHLVYTNANIATGVIGKGTGTVSLPRVSKKVYVRLIATNAGNNTSVSADVKSFMLFNPDAPVGTISITDTGVTNATFSVEVTDFGKDATSASVTVEVCASEDFTGAVHSFSASTDLEQTGSNSVSATGLANSTTYYARAIVVNDKNVELTTDAIEFLTLTPGYPNASGMISVHGYTSVSASTKATAIGLGSTETTRWLEVSENSDFSTLVGTSTLITSTDINVDGTLTVTGLSPETVYHVRICISNTWNHTAYVTLPGFTTRSEPFVASGPAWESGSGTFNFSLNVGGVYDDAVCEAVLTYGGTEIGTNNFTEAGTISWNGVTAAADGALAKIVVTATLPNDGGTFTRTYESPVAAGSSGQVVSDVSTHFSAANAVWMKPGDVVDLPTPTGVASYQVLNERFAWLDGNNLIALEPGIVGVRCVDENYVTNVMGVVILPDRIGNGSVYVFNETQHGGDGNAYSWSNSKCWRKVGSATNDSFPQNADDIAILPFYTKTYGFIRHLSDITIGGLYAGMIRPNASIDCTLERFKDVTTRTVTFRRTDGEPVRIQICPNSEGSHYSRIVLGSYDIDVVWASDAVIDGCSSETDVNGPRGRFYVKTSGSTNTLQNVTLTFRGFPGYKIEKNDCTDTLKGVWKGTGTIIKEGMGGIAFDGDLSGFDGTIRELSGPNLGGFNNGAAGVLMRAAAASNATAHVYGFVAADANGVPKFNGRGQGYFTTGFSSVGSEGGGQAPSKGLYMHGGSYFAKMISGTWGVGSVDEKLLDVLSIGAGMGFLTMDTPNNGDGQPINAVTAKTLAQADKGTFFFYDPSVNNNAATSVTNNMFTIRDWATHAVGGSGYGEAGVEGATNTFKIVPWFVAVGDSNYHDLIFSGVDSNGRLVRPVRTCTYIDEAGSEDANVSCYVYNKIGYGSLTHGTATDIVINSLFLNNSTTGDKWLGADRTLTIKSGGLIFQGNGSAIGLPGRDDNGSLVLGDATHPAYVWNKAFGNYTNQIWAAVTAPGGFVSTYTGNLELGGDQTGIGDEIVVAAGCLALGNAEHGITLAANLPIRVCAGATLKLVHAHALDNNPLKLDGSAGAFGKVELSGSRTCASLAVRDVFESSEWTTLPEGTYGLSDSGAEFVRDDLFVGPGVLTVGKPKSRGVMFLIY